MTKWGGGKNLFDYEKYFGTFGRKLGEEVLILLVVR